MTPKQEIEVMNYLVAQNKDATIKDFRELKALLENFEPESWMDLIINRAYVKQTQEELLRRSFLNSCSTRLGIVQQTIKQILPKRRRA